MRLGICSQFRNEAPYLVEWIRFHQAQGFSRFYLFDDKSNDDFREALDPYIRDGTVFLGSPPDFTEDLHRFDRQQVSFNVGLAMAKKECDWLAFIDVDEFLFAPKGALADVLPRNPFVAGVFIRWRMFGSSGHERPPEAGVVESYTRRARLPATREEMKAMQEIESKFFGENVQRPIPSGKLVSGKAIVRPRLVVRAGVHVPVLFFGRLIDENGVGVLVKNHRWFRFNGLRRTALRRSECLNTSEIIRINHYWSKSVSDMRSKAMKQGAAIGDYLRWDSEVLNAVEDREILRKSPRTGNHFERD
jgi:hypothetical protein